MPVQHAGHPMVWLAAQRGFQRHPGQRPVAARVSAEGKQYQRFDPPWLRQRARQYRPKRFGRTGVLADRQGI